MPSRSRPAAAGRRRAGADSGAGNRPRTAARPLPASRAPASGARSSLQPAACGVEHLRQLPADPQGRVQRRARVLGDVGDGAAPQLAQLAGGARRQRSRPSMRISPPVDPAAGTAVADQGHADGRLAAAGLADEPENLAGLDLDADPVDDVGAGGDELDLQVADRDRGGAASATLISLSSVEADRGSREAVGQQVGSDRQQRERRCTGSRTPHGCTVTTGGSR